MMDTQRQLIASDIALQSSRPAQGLGSLHIVDRWAGPLPEGTGASTAQRHPRGNRRVAIVAGGFASRLGTKVSKAVPKLVYGREKPLPISQSDLNELRSYSVPLNRHPQFYR